jgi:xanthine dehydrogenase accessory factor
MKELQEIVKAFENAQKRGLKTALATVVHVVGSAYRHEGARMLVTETGELTGAISGGCLEGDALRKARLCMVENRKMLVTYDTTDEDDATLGVGLGCNGIIQVLLEPLDPSNEQNPVQLFKAFLSKRQNAVLGTFFSLEDKLADQPGTCMLITEASESRGVLDSILQESFLKDAQEVLRSGQSIIQQYPDQKLTGFVEYLKPAIQLLIFGAGNDAIPLSQFAGILGWEDIVIDGRSNYSTVARFPTAKQVITAKPEEALKQVAIDNWTVAVLMTHNYNYDLSMLRQLSKIDIKYIGALGPKKKLQRMLDDLNEEGEAVTPDKLNVIFGPTGLDIGSETPEEIALSIVSEIKAVLSGSSGTSLKFKTPEHKSDQAVTKKHANAKFASCAINL